MAASRLQILAELEKKILWLACWTIHNANHVRENTDGIKVGGHQASSASLATIMTALYLNALRPQDRVAVKPHASPIFHAIQYLLGKQTREKLENFRAYKGAQSYPSRTKDTDDVDFSTGSVGLGVAQTLFSSLVQDYVQGHKWSEDTPEGRMIALIGDAELDEGNIFEAMLEGWKHGLRNCWWIIDYNRQSLDAVVREGLWERYENLFRNFGWEVVIVKYGSLQEAAFQEPGGQKLREWIDRCPNQLYSALTFQGGAAWRKRILDEIGDQGLASALIEKRSDEQLAELMGNLGMLLLGTKYEGGTLEGPGAEVCRADLTGLDCVTFFENALGMARILKKGTPTFDAFLRELTFTRYRGGALTDYTSRLHYTAEWMGDNCSSGFDDLRISVFQIQSFGQQFDQAGIHAGYDDHFFGGEFICDILLIGFIAYKILVKF